MCVRKLIVLAYSVNSVKPGQHHMALNKPSMLMQKHKHVCNRSTTQMLLDYYLVCVILLV